MALKVTLMHGMIDFEKKNAKGGNMLAEVGLG